MPQRLDIPARFAAAGIPLDADAYRLQHELEQRGWRVHVEEPLQDDPRRSGRSHGNRYRASGIRPVRDGGAGQMQLSDHAGQTGGSAEEALRKLLASILRRASGPATPPR